MPRPDRPVPPEQVLKTSERTPEPQRTRGRRSKSERSDRDWGTDETSERETRCRRESDASRNPAVVLDSSEERRRRAHLRAHLGTEFRRTYIPVASRD